MPADVLRILCFGDSLTHGYHQMGLADPHPYSMRLTERLRAALPEELVAKTRLDIRTSGQPGELASSKRFRDRFIEQMDSCQFHWVIVLAGTNDIAYNIDVDLIYMSLRYVWEYALDRRCHVLALTVPETGGYFVKADKRRNELNDHILNFMSPGFRSCHINEKMPHNSLSKELQSTYWDDLVHLKPKGYDWMGDHIADTLIPLIFGQPAKLDEEKGDDAKDISKGYVVVRKTDLH